MSEASDSNTTSDLKARDWNRIRDVIKDNVIVSLLHRTVLVDGLPESLNENSLRKDITRVLRDEYNASPEDLAPIPYFTHIKVWRLVVDSAENARKLYGQKARIRNGTIPILFVKPPLDIPKESPLASPATKHRPKRSSDADELKPKLKKTGGKSKKESSDDDKPPEKPTLRKRRPTTKDASDSDSSSGAVRTKKSSPKKRAASTSSSSSSQSPSSSSSASSSESSSDSSDSDTSPKSRLIKKRKRDEPPTRRKRAKPLRKPDSSSSDEESATPARQNTKASNKQSVPTVGDVYIAEKLLKKKRLASGSCKYLLQLTGVGHPIRLWLSEPIIKAVENHVVSPPSTQSTNTTLAKNDSAMPPSQFSPRLGDLVTDASELVERYPPSPSLPELEQIIGAKWLDYQLMFYVKWKDSPVSTFLPAAAVNRIAPMKVIEFYESRLSGPDEQPSDPPEQKR